MTKFETGTILKYHITDSQMHSIGKAIRPRFADPVTYVGYILAYWYRISAIAEKAANTDICIY